MSGQNIPLAAYLSPLYSGQVQEVFKENKWLVTDVMKASLELFLSCPKSLQDELVKRQAGQKDHCSIDDLVTVMRSMPGKVK